MAKIKLLIFIAVSLLGCNQNIEYSNLDALLPPDSSCIKAKLAAYSFIKVNEIHFLVISKYGNGYIDNIMNTLYFKTDSIIKVNETN